LKKLINPYLLPVGWIKISWDGRKNHGSCSFSFVKVDGFLEIIVEIESHGQERESELQRERERERERGGMGSKDKGGAFYVFIYKFSFLLLLTKALFVLLLFRVLRRRCFLTHKLLSL
jgi:hypothetical protein